MSVCYVLGFDFLVFVDLFLDFFFWGGGGGDYGVFNVIIRSPYSLSGECIWRLLSDSRQCIYRPKQCTGINMAY